MKNSFFLLLTGATLMLAVAACGSRAAMSASGPILSLESGDWHLINIQRESTSEDIPTSSSAPVTLRFAGGQFEGFGGCNGFGGGYAIAGDQLIIKDLARSESYCADASTREDQILQVLERSCTYRINGQRLEIDGGKHGTLVFLMQEPPLPAAAGRPGYGFGYGYSGAVKFAPPNP